MSLSKIQFEHFSEQLEALFADLISQYQAAKAAGTLDSFRSEMRELTAALSPAERAFLFECLEALK